MKNAPIMSADYLIPAERNSSEYDIKKSRFIAWACPASDRAQALQWLDEAKQAYPDARHHCWAYQIGPPKNPTAAAMSDDGEPSGTAGKPILNVLQHKNIGDVVIIVIRYFGGVKLGAGGLVRAYSHAAQLAMENINTSLKVAMQQYQVQLPFEQEHRLRHWLEQHSGELIHISYTETVIALCETPRQHQATFEEFLVSNSMAFVDTH